MTLSSTQRFGRWKYSHSDSVPRTEKWVPHKNRGNSERAERSDGQTQRKQTAQCLRNQSNCAHTQSWRSPTNSQAKAFQRNKVIRIDTKGLRKSDVKVKQCRGTKVLGTNNAQSYNFLSNCKSPKKSASHNEHYPRNAEIYEMWKVNSFVGEVRSAQLTQIFVFCDVKSYLLLSLR